MIEEKYSLITKLSYIQSELKAPKGQYNSFGKYKYRSCEDILEAVKPLLEGVVLVVSDEIVNLGDRYYVKATASISNGAQEIKATAFAREAEDKKGMDSSQLTGSCSSYARKYALNGLLCIDDTKDEDTRDNSSKAPKEAKAAPPKKMTQKELTGGINCLKKMVLNDCKKDKEEAERRFNNHVFVVLGTKEIKTEEELLKIKEGIESGKY